MKLDALKHSAYRQHLMRSSEFAVARGKRKKSKKKSKEKKGKDLMRKRKDVVGGSSRNSASKGGPSLSASAPTLNASSSAKEPNPLHRGKSNKLKLNIGVVCPQFPLLL